jgi:hypothetical protein
MSATSLLTIKQGVTKLSERERRDLAVFLHRLKQDTPSWKRETTRRLAAMEAGNKTSSAELRKRLNEK